MNGKLRIATSIVCLVLSIVIVGLAYLSNYDSLLAKPNAREIILLLLLINVLGNIVQIEEFVEKLFDDRSRIEEELYETLRKAAKDLEILLSSDQPQFPKIEPKKSR